MKIGHICNVHIKRSIWEAVAAYFSDEKTGTEHRRCSEDAENKGLVAVRMDAAQML